MKHKVGSKVYFYEFGHTGDKLLGVVTGIKENFDGSYTLEVDSKCKGVLTKTWEMSADFVHIIKY